MGRYDGPYFEADDENVVSVWVAKRPLSDIPDDYFEENYEGKDDEPFNQFSSDFGFGFYDHDFVESVGLPGCAPIAQFIRGASYGASFCEEVARQSQIKEADHVFLMYNFRYDPAVTGVHESKYYRFVGVYEYDENA